MIYFDFTIQNPWHNEKKRPWRDLNQGDLAVTKNKTLEWCIDYYTYDWFEIGIDTRWRGQDHAGPRLQLRLFGLGIDIALRDNRHWNNDANRWVDYNNPEEVEKWW
jgi:hypothetical protein